MTALANENDTMVVTSPAAGVQRHSGRRRVLLVLLGLAWCGAMPGQAQAGTIEQIQASGVLRCGVSTGTPGMSMPDSQGRWTGFHADICRALAIAVLSDSAKVRFIPVTAQGRFTALQSGEIDVLSSTTALTLTRDSTLGLQIPAVTFYTGQGFLVARRLGVTKPEQLGGATICSLQGSEVERNIVDFANKTHVALQTLPYDTSATQLQAFGAGRCDAISDDLVSLAARLVSLPRRDDYVVLDGTIAKEPHGPMVRSDDAQWAALVRWTVFALIQAEEFGLTRDTVAAARQNSADPKVLRFLGRTDDVGRGFGLRPGWAFDVIRELGNYGELYDRHAGKDGLGLGRGPNRLWTQGGLLVSWLWQ